MPRPRKKKKNMDDAAIKLFATRGLARTTIRDIARDAGVTEGALYRHYTGKDDMAWRLFRREVDVFIEGLEETLFEPGVDGVEKLAEGIRYLYRYYYDHPVRFSFILLTEHGFPGESLRGGAGDPIGMVVSFIEDILGKRGKSHEDCVTIAGMIMGMVLRPLLMHRYSRLEKHPVTQLGLVVNACTRVLDVL